MLIFMNFNKKIRVGVKKVVIYVKLDPTFIDVVKIM